MKIKMFFLISLILAMSGVNNAVNLFGIEIPDDGLTDARNTLIAMTIACAPIALYAYKKASANVSFSTQDDEFFSTQDKANITGAALGKAMRNNFALQAGAQVLFFIPSLLFNDHPLNELLIAGSAVAITEVTKNIVFGSEYTPCSIGDTILFRQSVVRENIIGPALCLLTTQYIKHGIESSSMHSRDTIFPICGLLAAIWLLQPDIDLDYVPKTKNHSLSRSHHSRPSSSQHQGDI